MKWIIRTFGAVIILPIIAILIWYLFSFLPHLNKLNSIITKEENQISSVSDIFKLAVMTESTTGLRSYATRQAFHELVFSKEPKGNIDWHLNTALWYLSSYIHFNNRKIFYLWSAYAPFGKGHGLQNSALHHFGKELSELSLRQKAEIIAMVKGPSLYKLGSEKLNNRVNIILGKINELKL